MSGTVIESGWGQNNKLKINEEGCASVCGYTTRVIHHVSQVEHQAFVVGMHLAQAAGGTTEGCGYIKYNGDDVLIIDQIRLSTEEPTGGLTKWGLWVNPTVYTGGAASTPVNLWLPSSIELDASCVQNNDGTALTITGGSSMTTIRAEGGASILVDTLGALALGKNDIFAVMGNAATTGTKTRAYVWCYIHTGG